MADHHILTYTGGLIDRAGARRKDPAWIAECLASPSAVVLPMTNGRTLVSGATPLRLPVRSLASLGIDEWVLLGIDSDHPVFVAEVPDDAGLEGEFVELRRVTPALSVADAAMLAYARGMLIWHRRHRHCGVCGAATVARHAGHMRQCPSCGAETYPRTDPAVIMLVERHAPGEPPRCLLAHHGRLAPGMFSTLAGFVEPGESLEEAVAREVLEETGVSVSTVRYMGSQPWPFPASLMIGFRAVAETDAITIDPDELTEARWFSAAELREAGEWGDAGDGLKLPRRDSVARWLVDGWLAGE